MSERTDPNQIASSLSEAQRKALLTGDLDSLTNGQWKKLCLTGCTWYRAADIDFDTGYLAHSRRQMRAKGLAVRAIIERDSNGK